MLSSTSPTLIFTLILLNQVVAEFCEKSVLGHSCLFPQKCCGDTCCVPQNQADHYHRLHWSVWNMWFIIIFILMSCFGGCGYWRRYQLLLAQERNMMLGQTIAPQGIQGRSRPSRGGITNATMGFTGPTFFGVRNGHFQGFDIFSMNQQSMPSGGNAPPQGSFPDPPAYSEVVKDAPFDPYKDDLPPYPGLPYSVPESNQYALPPQHPHHVVALPPYTVIDQNPQVEGAASASCSEPTRPNLSCEPTSQPSMSLNSNSEISIPADTTQTSSRLLDSHHAT